MSNVPTDVWYPESPSRSRAAVGDVVRMRFGSFYVFGRYLAVAAGGSFAKSRVFAVYNYCGNENVNEFLNIDSSFMIEPFFLHNDICREGRGVKVSNIPAGALASDPDCFCMKVARFWYDIDQNEIPGACGLEVAASLEVGWRWAALIKLKLGLDFSVDLLGGIGAGWTDFDMIKTYLCEMDEGAIRSQLDECVRRGWVERRSATEDLYRKLL